MPAIKTVNLTRKFGDLIAVNDLNDLYYFVQVVDHGGFAPAGRVTNIPKSKLSRRIALLEERLTRISSNATV